MVGYIAIAVVSIFSLRTASDVFHFVFDRDKCVSSGCSLDPSGFGICTADCGPYYGMSFPWLSVIISVAFIVIAVVIIQKIKKPQSPA